MKLFSQLLFASILAASSSAQTTWFVDASASVPGDGSEASPFQHIQMGLDASAIWGDTVRVLGGTYVENLALVGKSVELVAAFGLGSVTVDGGGAGPVLTIQDHPLGYSTVVTGLRFENGAGAQVTADVSRGGGLHVIGPASTAFGSCEFIGNSANHGGGVYLEGGSHTFAECALDANFGDVGGGLFATDANLLLQASSISDNTSLSGFSAPVEYRGTGIFIEPSTSAGSIPTATRVEDCNVSRNGARYSSTGAGIYVASPAQVMIQHTAIVGNGRTAGMNGGTGGFGGGISAGSDTTLENCEIRDNGLRTSLGGGLFGELRARNCIISGNQAADGGGAFRGSFEDCLFEGNSGGGLCCAEGALGGGASGATLVRCVLRANRVFNGLALEGAGAYNCDLQSCLVEYNYVQLSSSPPFSSSGGGLYRCTAVDTIIRGNSAPAGGGAARCGGFKRSLLRCTLVGNRAFDTGGGAAESTLEDCTLSSNSAGSFGGGAVQCELTRCVLSGNSASSCAGAAGGVLSFCTVTGNRASYKAGGVGSTNEVLPPFFGFTTSIQNSIVYANEPDNVSLVDEFPQGTPTLEAEWSLIQGGYAGTGNLDADGLVSGPYSGNAQLLAGSPAIDSADPTAPLDPDGSRADMGAIPFDPAYVPGPTAFCTGKASALDVVPMIGWSGSPTLSGPDDFAIGGTELNGRSFALVALASGPAATEAYGGTICVGQGLVRLGVLATGGTLGASDGTIAAPLPQAQLAGYGPGSLLYAQLLVRDVNHPDGSGAALSGGLEFRVLP